jgi:hypothetical protein
MGAAYHVHRLRSAHHWVPPRLVEPKAGPRAPSTEILGVRVGVSRFGDARAVTREWGVSCADRSMRVLMGELRDKKRQEIERAKARGTPDAVTGASIIGRRSARDENPQVRYSCDDVDSTKLADRARAPSKGRLLYIFDDEAGPVRNASFQRNLSDHAAALADFDATRDAIAARLGPFAETELGQREGTGPDAPLAKFSRRTVEWRFSDVVATVSLANLGGRGFAVSESLEVPLPLYADAPTRPRK